jgi:hypothetical protein
MRPARFIRQWLRGEPPAQIDALVTSGQLTAREAAYFVALCRSGRGTPPWLATKIAGRNHQEMAPG